MSESRLSDRVVESRNHK